MNKLYFIISFLLCCVFIGCGDQKDFPNEPEEPNNQEEPSDEYDESLIYSSYKGLVMAGYQGWFAADGDDSNRGWYHYGGGNNFKPGGSVNIDFWPDMGEYTIKYKTPFKFADGSDAYLFSPYDEETVDLHFKWMKEYGIDGVFMQRFVGEVKNSSGKRHFNKVLENALKAAKKYERAICVMYDLSGSSSSDMDFIRRDWAELQTLFSLTDKNINPTYLYHNKKPLLVLWGVGFNDGRNYTVANVDNLVDKFKELDKVSIMLGIPYYWRELRNDTENNPALHTLIKKADVILPWAVGRYDSNSYQGTAEGILRGDISWCQTNKVDYVPLVFPGFSWGNLRKDPTIYDQIPRNKGNFMWKQIAGAKTAGAEMLYVAMFDEVDEGTAIFKCARENELPLNGEFRFVGIENELDSDFYLWLTGEAGKWLRNEAVYTSQIPDRN